MKSLLLLAALLAASAAPAAAALSPEKKAKIEAVVARFRAESRAPGVSVAVVEGGEPAWAAGFGFSDLEGGVAASSATLYRLGSISKPITAVAAMKLWEGGKFDLDAPVRKYCPAFPSKEGDITVRRLLGHLAGIRHYRTEGPEFETNNTKHFENPIQGGLSLFAADPLVDKPGAKFHYTTQGFTLVGCAMEGASGKTFLKLARANVFAPAGMTTAREDDRFAVVANRARFYSKDSSGTVTNAEFLDSSYKIPGGGFIASSADMGRFMSALLQDRLVKRETRDLMWTSQKDAAGAETGYGYGFGVEKAAGLPAAGHTGHQQGTSTAFVVVPAKNAGVAVLANMDDVDAKAPAEEILAILLN